MTIRNRAGLLRTAALLLILAATAASVVWKGPVEADPCPPYIAAVETVYYADAAKTQEIGSCLRDCWGNVTCDGSTSSYTNTYRYRCDC